MKILAILGSASEKGSNLMLLDAIKAFWQKKANNLDIEIFNDLRNFPLFRPEDLKEDLPQTIIDFKRKLNSSELVIISTPEYTHNIPAVLKNALEWITASGELANKKIIAITFTPKAPRGEFAMQSLLFSLKTMNCKVISELSFYKNEISTNKGSFINFNDEQKFILTEVGKMAGIKI